jgi:hypothetical protein
MSKYQLLECNVALAGDLLNVVNRSAFRPITYPELIVLEFLHGESAVSDVFDVGETADMPPQVEKRRLEDTYGDVVGKHLFPGHHFQLPERNDRFQRRLVGTKVNPGPAPQVTDTEVDPAIAAGAKKLTAKAAV